MSTPTPTEIHTSSGAHLLFTENTVIKTHRAGTNPLELVRRLSLWPSDVGLTALQVDLSCDPPNSTWPRVHTMNREQPDWRGVGELLGRLHRPAPPQAPVHGWGERLVRAVQPLRAGWMRDLGISLVTEVAARFPAGQPDGTWLIHGDFHLGQLGLVPRSPLGTGANPQQDPLLEGFAPASKSKEVQSQDVGPLGTAEVVPPPDYDLVLLDPDDFGVGDPAWDLARIGGFWAAGLIDDADWFDFFRGYRSTAVTPLAKAKHPWDLIDLPARVAVFVAASRQRLHSPDTAFALREACRAMANLSHE
ncbi:MAG: hypothetical protein Q4C87_06840 [Actinomycetaceae bacterium]|nr:hypothetical protein [Actinomycetaceae bacterium]